MVDQGHIQFEWTFPNEIRAFFPFNGGFHPFHKFLRRRLSLFQYSEIVIEF